MTWIDLNQDTDRSDVSEQGASGVTVLWALVLLRVGRNSTMLMDRNQTKGSISKLCVYNRLYQFYSAEICLYCPSSSIVSPFKLMFQKPISKFVSFSLHSSRPNGSSPKGSCGSKEAQLYVQHLLPARNTYVPFAWFIVVRVQ